MIRKAAEIVGPRFEAIVEEAERCGADMIVMVTHGRSRLGEWYYGSHSKKVLSLSKLPLLVLH